MARLLYGVAFTGGLANGLEMIYNGEIAGGALYLGLSWPWAFAASGYQPFVVK